MRRLLLGDELHENSRIAMENEYDWEELRQEAIDEGWWKDTPRSWVVKGSQSSKSQSSHWIQSLPDQW